MNLRVAPGSSEGPHPSSYKVASSMFFPSNFQAATYMDLLGVCTNAPPLPPITLQALKRVIQPDLDGHIIPTDHTEEQMPPAQERLTCLGCSILQSCIQSILDSLSPRFRPESATTVAASVYGVLPQIACRSGFWSSDGIHKLFPYIYLCSDSMMRP